MINRDWNIVLNCSNYCSIVQFDFHIVYTTYIVRMALAHLPILHNRKHTDNISKQPTPITSHKQIITTKAYP